MDDIKKLEEVFLCLTEMYTVYACLNLQQESGVDFQIGNQVYNFRGTLTLVASHFIGGYKQLSSASAAIVWLSPKKS